MNRLNCSIGIDIGTTSVKVIAVLESGKQINRRTQRLTMFTSDDGMAEQDPHAVAQTVNELLAAVATQVTQAGFHIACVGFSAAMHSLLPISADGQALGNAITWLDTRAKDEAYEIWRTKQGRDIYSRTGTPIHAMSPLVKLIWMNHHSQALFARAARFASLKEWIWYQWFHEWSIDESMASATGLFNLHTRTWDCDALAFAQITEAHLSQLVPTTYIRTGIQDETLLKAGFMVDTPFNIGASDGVLANLGSGVVDSKAMVLTIGTSLALRTGGQFAITDTSFRPFCYVLDKQRFIIGSPSNSGGIVLDWLFTNILSIQPDSCESIDFGQLCRDAEFVDVDNLICIPHVSGERAPVWDERATGSFIGLQRHHQQVHLVRAAIEGIIFNAYWIAMKLFDIVGKPQYIMVSGRLFGHTWIRQFCANVFGIQMRYHNGGDASTMGAILLANHACSNMNVNEDSLCSPFPGEFATTDTVAEEHSQQQPRFLRFVQLFEAIYQSNNVTE